LSSISILNTTGEALSYLGQEQAMIEEMSALHNNCTWDLVPLPDGTIDRLKAWLAAKGYTQIFGLDYGDTISSSKNNFGLFILVYGCYSILAPLSVGYQECFSSWPSH
jgi:hypothetical protein